MTHVTSFHRTEATNAPPRETSVVLDQTSRTSWREVKLSDEATVWLFGYTKQASDESAAQTLRSAVMAGVQAVEAWARQTIGHGAVVYSGAEGVVAATDIVGSVPLYISREADRLVIRSNLRLPDGTDHNFDRRAVLQLAMGGFTIGRQCLGSSVQSLRPGEVAFLGAEGPQFLRYARYVGSPSSDAAADPRDPDLQKRHNDVFLAILAEMTAPFRGRPVFIPLSAGLDSRAILSGLKEIGYDKIFTFSYGLPGNHEAEGAQRIAKSLDVDWRMIEYSPHEQVRFFNGDTAARFFEFADRPDAMPFMQDVPAIERLQKMTDIPQDAVFINGQSGDFIAGNHIPPDLHRGETGLREAIIAKHFSFWDVLKTPENLSRIREAIDLELGSLRDEKCAAIPYELFEFESRQSKYVVAGQRAYEFFGYDWRLPFWDAKMVAFWQDIPVSAKLNRSLFRAAMESANWGKVWGPDWEFPRTVVPTWLRPLRFLAKAASAPFGRARWHRLEKRVFDWRMDPVQNYAIRSYPALMRDGRGFRNALALHAESYLARHGVQIDDLIRGVWK